MSVSPSASLSFSNTPGAGTLKGVSSSVLCPSPTASGGLFGGPARYSTCSKGAPAASPLYDSATRLPVPVMINASELPSAQPGRLTISWMTEVRSGVCWSGPASPLVVQAGGDQDTAAVVLARLEMLPSTLSKVSGLGAACPSMVRLVAPESVSSTWNWT